MHRPSATTPTASTAAMRRECTTRRRLPVPSFGTFFCFVVIVMNAVAATDDADDECDGGVLDCRKPPILQHTGVFRSDYCLYQEARSRCVDEYAQQCLPRDMWETFHLQWRNYRTTVSQTLCSSGGLYKQEHQKHLKCLNAIDAEFMGCSRRHQAELATIGRDDRQQCTSYRKYTRCVLDVVMSICGAQTTEFAGYILNQVTSSLLEFCGNHGNEMDEDEPWSPSTDDILTAVTVAVGWTALVGLVVVAIVCAVAITRRAAQRYATRGDIPLAEVTFSLQRHGLNI